MIQHRLGSDAPAENWLELGSGVSRPRQFPVNVRPANHCSVNLSQFSISFPFGLISTQIHFHTFQQWSVALFDPWGAPALGSGEREPRENCGGVWGAAAPQGAVFGDVAALWHGSFNLFKDRQSAIFGVWPAPWAPETLPKGGGATFWTGLRGPRGRPDPQLGRFPILNKF